MNKHTVIVLGIIFCFSFVHSSQAQKEKFHSIFLYNFSKYVKWPENHTDGIFTIGVFGNSAIEKELKAMASSKKANGLPIEIKRVSSTQESAACDLLYVSKSESKKLTAILDQLAGNPVLVVTDGPGLAQKGSAINFIEKDGKVKFEMNQHAIEKTGLKVSGSLTSLAILI